MTNCTKYCLIFLKLVLFAHFTHFFSLPPSLSSWHSCISIYSSLISVLGEVADQLFYWIIELHTRQTVQVYLKDFSFMVEKYPMAIIIQGPPWLGNKHLQRLAPPEGSRKPWANSIVLASLHHIRWNGLSEKTSKRWAGSIKQIIVEIILIKSW